MRKFTIPNDLLAALHFVNGSRINLVAGKLFKIIEPRNGFFLIFFPKSKNFLKEIYLPNANRLLDLILRLRYESLLELKRSGGKRRGLIDNKFLIELLFF